LTANHPAIDALKPLHNSNFHDPGNVTH